MAVLVVTTIVLFAAVLIYLAHHLVAGELAQIRNQSTPLRQTIEPPLSSCTAVRLNREDWQGLCKVWQSICKRYPAERETALMYADLVMSDLVRDRPDVAESKALVIPLDDAISRQYHTAHDIVAHSGTRTLNSSEFDRAMDLYKNLFEELCAIDELSRVSGH